MVQSLAWSSTSSHRFLDRCYHTRMPAQPLVPSFTPYVEVNEVLQELMEGLRAILGSQLSGAYLYGSLTSTEFDSQSDIDVLVVTRDEMSDEVFAMVAAMHDRIATGDSWCATQLEVAYVPFQTLRRYDAENSVYPHMDRGKGEHLQRKEHWSDCVVQRHVLRERGITLAGPDPVTLIDPVSEDDLRQAMRDLLAKWGESLLGNPSQLERLSSSVAARSRTLSFRYAGCSTRSRLEQSPRSDRRRTGRGRHWTRSGARWWIAPGRGDKTLTRRRPQKTLPAPSI